MTTLQDLRKREKNREKLREKLLTDLEAVREEIAKLTQEADTAAKGGDLTSYTKRIEKKSEAQAREYVLEAQYNATEKPDVTEQEAQEAWADVRKRYDPLFKEMMDSLEELKAVFSAKVEALLLLQNGALRDREELARMIGINATEERTGGAAYPSMELPTLPIDHRISNSLVYNGIRYSGDIAYYAYLNNLSLLDPEMQRLFRTVNLQRG